MIFLFLAPKGTQGISNLDCFGSYLQAAISALSLFRTLFWNVRARSTSSCYYNVTLRVPAHIYTGEGIRIEEHSKNQILFFSFCLIFLLI